MNKGNPRFNCLGFIKRQSEFRPLADYRSEEFYQPGKLPDELREPIIAAFRQVLGVTETRVNNLRGDKP